MGPRSFDRGKRLSALIPVVPVVASMGPRSFDRGKASRDVLSGRLPQPLQWGRDRLIAERHVHHKLILGPALLQWGRDRLIAERVALGLNPHLFPRRFNGAAIV